MTIINTLLIIGGTGGIICLLGFLLKFLHKDIFTRRNKYDEIVREKVKRYTPLSDDQYEK